MQVNENKIHFQSPIKMIKKPFSLLQSNEPVSTERKYFQRKSTNQKNNLSICRILTKDNQSIQQTKRHVKSGFILGRKEIISESKNTEYSKRNSSVNSILKRRVNSESKVSACKNPIQKGHIQQKSLQRQNFTEKLIEGLKKAHFKLGKPTGLNTRYRQQKQQRQTEKTMRGSMVIRQKLMQKSIQKLKPSLNINEARFHSSKKSLRRLSQQSQQQRRIKNCLNNRVSIGKMLIETRCKSENEQMLQKLVKKCSQPLASYSEFIKGSAQTEYSINIECISILKNHSSQSLMQQIDSNALKILSSIYLCLVEMLGKLRDKKIKNKGRENLLEQEIEVIRQYVQVYFHTYNRMKIEVIMCEILFKQVRKRLYQFFILQRIILYWIHENIQKHSRPLSQTDPIEKIMQFLQLSDQVNKTLLNILFEEMASYNSYGLNQKNKMKNRCVDTFKTLRLIREVEKRLCKLKQITNAVVQINLKNNETALSMTCLMQKLQKNDNTDMAQLYQLQQYFNWIILLIPPLLYLPLIASKSYTLVIDLDETLIYYNQETKILKYRPYMDRFLTSMKKHFELIIFSSHPKQRSDIIISEIERDGKIFQYRLYRSHMVFQEGGLRKNVRYLGRSMQKIVFIDDDEKNTECTPLNSYKIASFTGDKKDKQLLNLADRLTTLIQTQPLDISGKLKQHKFILDEVVQVDEASSTIQLSISDEERDQTISSICHNE